MTKDMTTGSPMKLIISFFIPLMLGTLFQQFYSMVDAIVVGKFVGVNALAGVGATGSINFLIIGFANGVCSGFGIMFGQSFGAKDYRAMRNYIANAIYLSIVIAVVLTPVTMLLARPVLVWMNTPAEIIEDAYLYIVIIFAGLAVTMMYNSASAILRAIGDSRTPLYVLIASSAINIALDLLFVLVFKMGVAGVAVATVVAQGVSGIVCYIYMFKRYEVLKFSHIEWRRDFRKMKRLLCVGLPMALQFSITAIGSMIMQVAVNGLGAASVAAMTAASKINLIFGGALETIGIAMSTYCSQNMGAKQYKRIRRGVTSGNILACIFAVIFCVIIRLFGAQIALLFIDASETAIIGDILSFLNMTSMFYPVLGILFILRNSIQGMGYGFLPMFAGLFELIGRAFVAFGLVGKYGFYGVTLANPCAWVAADILLISVYFYIRSRVLTKKDNAAYAFTEADCQKKVNV